MKNKRAIPIPIGRQKEVVYLPATGHTIVLGTAGSGKTTMAMLRAIRLQKNFTNPEERTLLVTFNKMLLSYMHSFQASVPTGLDILNYHKVARGFLNSRGKMQGWNLILNPDQTKATVEKALIDVQAKVRAPVLRRPSPVFYEEIRWLEQFGIRNLDNYLKSERIGRKGTRINGAVNRKAVWKVYQQYQSLRVQQGRMYDWDDLALAVQDELNKNNSDWMYRHIVIDEGQDFSPSMLRSLSLGIPANGSLTFFGDVAQQIYGVRVSWKNSGLNAEQIWRFRENYRNSKEIAKLALAISKMPYFDDEPDIVEPREPAAAGPKPLLVKFPNTTTERSFVVSNAVRLAGNQRVGILVKKRSEVKLLLKAIPASQNLRVVELHGDRGQWFWDPGIMVGTYNSAKGLEFETVFMPYCSEELMPDEERVNEVGNDEACEEEASTSRRKSLSSLGGQRTTSIGPFEGFGHRLVEVVNEVQDALTQIIGGGKAGSFE